jgi:hypothetical protein
MCPSLPQSGLPAPQNADGPGIFPADPELMRRVVEQPQAAEALLDVRKTKLLKISIKLI